MYSFKELRKASKLSVSGKEIRVAILGNCATQFFATSLLGCAKLSSLNISVFDADYNQVDAQLIDSSSEVYQSQPDVIILWLATEKLYEDFLDLSLSEREDFADSYISKIENYWELVRKNTNAKVIQFNFSEFNDYVLGQYSSKVKSTFTYQLRKLNYLLEEAMNRNANVYPVDILAIQIQLGQDVFFDAKYYYNAKMNVSTNALPYVANAVTDVLKSMLGKLKKCIVLDLDNTLWGGVIGDDGIHNIEIGELGKGHAFTNFQRWLKQLKEYGIILAVCSKNDEEIAKEPFVNHEEMILKMEDISIFVANWDDKATNIKKIQESLNIGMDSIVFVDDNPFERNLVRELLDGIEVPELPEDPACYLEFLQRCNYFDTVSYTGVGSDRTKLYQAEFERKKSEALYASLDEYLESLKMVGYAGPFEKSRYSRIAQLTQRSNQFNLRTVRYTEEDIKQISESDEYITLFYTLKDKYGDHGLVGVVIMKQISDEELFIDTWLMSCRVLKRGMEEFIVNKIMKTAKENGYKKVSAEYIPTNKNKMVQDIYSKMGFDLLSDNKYEIIVNNYVNRSTYIKEVGNYE